MGTRLIDEKFANVMGRVCDLEVIGTPSRLRLTVRRKWKNTPMFDSAD
jgi:hypothetical protein